MNEVKCRFGAGIGAEVPFCQEWDVSEEAAAPAVAAAEAMAVEGGAWVRELPSAAPRHYELDRAYDVAGKSHEFCHVT